MLGNIPKRFCKLGTVGKQLPGVSLKLESVMESDSSDAITDCEEKTLAVISRASFMGYINRETENKVSLLCYDLMCCIRWTIWS